MSTQIASTVPTVPPVESDGALEGARVLVADDEPGIRRILSRILQAAGCEVATVENGRDARTMLEASTFDLLISDIVMPGMNGVDLLQRVREDHPDLPVILVTSTPTTDTAIRAVRHRATAYLTKPINPQDLLEEVRTAVRMSRIAAIRREAVALLERNTDPASADEAEAFERALLGAFMVYQPIVWWSERRIFGYETLLRSPEPSLPHPGAVFDAAERLNRLTDLGRTIRARCGGPMAEADAQSLLFVNLHSRDLSDEALYDPTAPLSALASRVVLEITERARIDHIDGLDGRIRRLRDMGYRIAVDDIGAGYSGLNSFATLQPDLIKLDLALVRGIDTDRVKQRLVRLLVELCADLGIGVVGEGVETAAERDRLVELGCDLFQGYLFARPGAPFPVPAY